MSSSQNPNPDNPIKWILEDYYGHKSQGAYNGAKDVYFDGEVAFVPWLEQRGLSPREVTESHIRDWFEDLKSEYKPGTQQKHASRVNLAYSKMLNRGVVGIDVNPVDKPLDEDILDEPQSEPLPIYEKAVICALLSYLPPTAFIASLIMAKTTRRIGEIVNLDLKDVNLDHPAADWEVVPSLSDKPDHIHFGPESTGGEMFRGELRNDGSKTETHTMIPIDEELKQALIWWLSIRRGDKTDNPLILLSCSIPPRRPAGDTISKQLRNARRKVAESYPNVDEDVISTHYFRHWTTTKMGDRVNQSVVDYMRGDKNKITDVYNHYSENKKEQWLNNMFTFFD